MTSGGRRTLFLLVVLVAAFAPARALADVPTELDIPDSSGSIVIIGIVGLVILLAAAALIAWAIVRLNRKAAALPPDDASASPPDAPSGL